MTDVRLAWDRPLDAECNVIRGSKMLSRRTLLTNAVSVRRSTAVAQPPGVWGLCVYAGRQEVDELATQYIGAWFRTSTVERLRAEGYDVVPIEASNPLHCVFVLSAEGHVDKPEPPGDNAEFWRPIVDLFSEPYANSVHADPE